jgi:2'-hydroxyisoflavone reductase
MHVLVLGGRSFVGRHLVLAARAAGLEVTLFNRGRTNPGLFADLEHIAGDRDGGIAALAGRTWDAVLDVNGYLPRIVDSSVRALAGSCRHYTFISTVSVYASPGATGPDEDAPLGRLSAPTEEVTGETYGPLKAACEAAVREAFGAAALVVRPGVVVGPYDHTERFVRWTRRAADGGEMLAPGTPDGPVQLIDGRDLADWTVRMILRGAGGTFNAVRPSLSWGELLRTCVDVAGAGTTLTWVDEDFLTEQGVAEWADLPLWLHAEHSGMARADVSRAVDAGLTFRPLADTVRATMEWDRSRGDARLAGLPVDRERAVLAAWHRAGG